MEDISRFSEKPSFHQVSAKKHTENMLYSELTSLLSRKSSKSTGKELNREQLTTKPTDICLYFGLFKRPQAFSENSGYVMDFGKTIVRTLLTTTDICLYFSLFKRPQAFSENWGHVMDFGIIRQHTCRNTINSHHMMQAWGALSLQGC